MERADKLARRICFRLGCNMESTVDSIQLKKFGLVLAFGLIAIFGLLFPLLKDNPLPFWPYATGMVVLIPTFIKPQWLKVLYGPWMKIGHCLGWVNTRIILGFIFYALITPMGILMRLLGKDPMCRTYDKEATTYRKISIVQPPSHMEKPF